MMVTSAAGSPAEVGTVNSHKLCVLSPPS